MNFFWGRWKLVDMPLSPLGSAADRAGEHAYKDPVETGLSVVSERDEVYFRLRYTF
jgi:hypothetical protein